MTSETALEVVRSTVIFATPLWAAGEVLMRRSRELDTWARAAWTGALALNVLHVVLAFQFVYAWNHQAAIEATVRQTAETVGSSWRGGIYLNYVFLALWLADDAWWWTDRDSHASRSGAFETTRFAIFVFMFVNAAIIFASGAGRIIGIVSVTAALFAAPLRRLTPRLA